MSGGYDDGYRACACFWGHEPGSLVRLLVSHIDCLSGMAVLDAGCGEGKNAAFLALQGAQVRAIDVSELALKNAMTAWGSSPNIEWQIADIRNIRVSECSYDVTIAYGLLHCLASKNEVISTVYKLQQATKPSGFVLVCAFNDRLRDLRAHPGFNPCLLPHEFYLELFEGWFLIESSDRDLTETHPHNLIEHTHSMTRILAQKPNDN